MVGTYLHSLILSHICTLFLSKFPPPSYEKRSIYFNTFYLYYIAPTTVYCWGAKCEPDPTDSTIAICRCPQVNSPAGSIIGVDATVQCAAQEGNVCNYVHNGGSRDW